jgi:hypothetical protein
MRSNADAAPDARQEIIEVYMAWRRGNSGDLATVVQMLLQMQQGAMEERRRAEERADLRQNDLMRFMHDENKQHPGAIMANANSNGRSFDRDVKWHAAVR